MHTGYMMFAAAHKPACAHEPSSQLLPIRGRESGIPLRRGRGRNSRGPKRHLARTGNGNHLSLDRASASTATVTVEPPVTAPSPPPVGVPRTLWRRSSRRTCGTPPRPCRLCRYITAFCDDCFPASVHCLRAPQTNQNIQPSRPCRACRWATF